MVGVVRLFATASNPYYGVNMVCCQQVMPNNIKKIHGGGVFGLTDGESDVTLGVTSPG